MQCYPHWVLGEGFFLRLQSVSKSVSASASCSGTTSPPVCSFDSWPSCHYQTSLSAETPLEMTCFQIDTTGCNTKLRQTYFPTLTTFRWFLQGFDAFMRCFFQTYPYKRMSRMLCENTCKLHLHVIRKTAMETKLLCDKVWMFWHCHDSVFPQNSFSNNWIIVYKNKTRETNT